jgi:hypothetical protein
MEDRDKNGEKRPDAIARTSNGYSKKITTRRAYSSGPKTLLGGLVDGRRERREDESD